MAEIKEQGDKNLIEGLRDFAVSEARPGRVNRELRLRLELMALLCNKPMALVSHETGLAIANFGMAEDDFGAGQRLSHSRFKLEDKDNISYIALGEIIDGQDRDCVCLIVKSEAKELEERIMPMLRWAADGVMAYAASRYSTGISAKVEQDGKISIEYFRPVAFRPLV